MKTYKSVTTNAFQLLVLSIYVFAVITLPGCATKNYSLYQAIYDRQNDKAEKLITEGANLETVVNEDGWTALLLAVDRGDYNLTEQLLQAGAKVNVQLKNGNTPLHLAAIHDNDKIIKLLLQHKAKINIFSNEKGATPLYNAAYRGNEHAVEALLEAGADYNITYNEWSPINAAAYHGQKKVVEILHRYGSEYTIYVYAALNDLEELKQAKRSGEDLFKRGPYGMTTLNFAVKNGCIEAADFLIKNGADVLQKNDGGFSVIHTAAENGKTEMVKLLLERGVGVNELSTDGQSPLYFAARNGHADTVRYFIEQGADVEIGYNEWRPLSVSASNGHTEVVKALLDSGRVQVDAATKDGETALYKASLKGHADVIKLLLDAGADPQKGYKGWTSLHAAVDEGHVEAAEVLLDYGASLDAKLPSSGETPLDIALKKNNSKMITLLSDDYGRKALKKAEKHVGTGDKDTVVGILTDAVNYYDGKINEQEKDIAKLEKRLQELNYGSSVNQALQGMALSSRSYGVYGQTVSNQMGINDARSQIPKDIEKEKRLQNIYKDLRVKYTSKLNCLKTNSDISACLES